MHVSRSLVLMLLRCLESKRRFSWEFHDNRRQRVERLLQSQAEAGTTRDRRNEDEVTANPVGSDSLSRGQVFSLLSKLHRLIAVSMSSLSLIDYDL